MIGLFASEDAIVLLFIMFLQISILMLMLMLGLSMRNRVRKYFISHIFFQQNISLWKKCKLKCKKFANWFSGQISNSLLPE